MKKVKLAKLYIEGIREPFTITEEQGRQADQIISSKGDFKGLAIDAPVKIGDIWSGKKKDMRYVVFQDAFAPTPQKIYGRDELIEFEKELDRYIVKEGDDEYNRFVGLYLADIKAGMEDATGDVGQVAVNVGRWTTKTKQMILDIRAKKLDEAGMKSEAERLAKMNIVGRLTLNGENRYYADKGAIRIDEKGETFVLRDAMGEIPLSELSRKIESYRAMKSRDEFINSLREEQYEGMYEAGQNAQ